MAASKTQSPWRYPGGKRRLVGLLEEQIADFDPTLRWVEPFVGGGGFLTVADRPEAKQPSVFADYDWRVASWWAVVAGPQADYDELINLILEAEPTVELHTKLRQLDNDVDLVTAAFSGIMLNRMSFSGILHGSPIGGKGQKSQWGVGCRFNPPVCVAQHHWVRSVIEGATIITGDFEEALAFDGLAVCDPPYVEAGPGIYKHSFTEDDHRRLARVLKARSDPWILTYDGHELVHELYAGCTIRAIPVRYSMRGKKNTWEQDHELVISP